MPYQTEYYGNEPEKTDPREVFSEEDGLQSPHKQLTEDVKSSWKCSRCQKLTLIEDIFVLSHAGPKISLRPYCEPCADLMLTEYQSGLEGKDDCSF